MSASLVLSLAETAGGRDQTWPGDRDTRRGLEAPVRLSRACPTHSSCPPRAQFREAPHFVAEVSEIS